MEPGAIRENPVTALEVHEQGLQNWGQARFRFPLLGMRDVLCASFNTQILHVPSRKRV